MTAKWYRIQMGAIIGRAKANSPAQAFRKVLKRRKICASTIDGKMVHYRNTKSSHAGTWVEAVKLWSKP